MKPSIIVIAGPSASGKTSLISWLEQRHPEKVSTIQVDRYYLNLDHIPEEKRLSFNFDHPDALEWSLLETHLKQLLTGNTIECPGYCYVKCTRTEDTTLIQPKPIILVDGLLTLSMPNIRQLIHTAIYIDTPIDICLARKMKRDNEERGRSIDQIIEQYLSLTRPMYYEYVLPSRQYANLILPSISTEQQYNLIEEHLKLSKQKEFGPQSNQ